MLVESRRLTRPRVLLLAVSILLACGGREEGPPAGGNGITAATRILWRGDPLKWPVSVVLIGNTLVVADRAELHYLSLDGTHTRTVGAAGEGPEEFGRITAIGQYGEYVLVRDEGLQRISVYDAEGQQVTSSRFTLRGSTQPTAPFLRPAGAGYLHIVWPRILPRETPVETTLMWSAFESDSTASIGRWRDRQLRSVDRANSWARPLGPRAHVAIGPGGRWAQGDGLDYCIAISSSRDAGRKTACRGWARVGVNRAVRSPDWSRISAMVGLTDEQLQAWKRNIAIEDFDDEFPSYDRLVYAETGDLWVRTIGQSRGNVHPSLAETYSELRPALYEWGIHNAEGQYRATVLLPSAFEPRHITDGVVYGIQRMSAGDFAIVEGRWGSPGAASVGTP